jgi:hypothetical protein
LKGCQQLKRLGISNTDINSGLEYLPTSLENFFLISDLRVDSLSKQLELTLKCFLQPGETVSYDYVFLLKRYQKAHSQERERLEIIESVQTEGF